MFQGHRSKIKITSARICSFILALYVGISIIYMFKVHNRKQTHIYQHCNPDKYEIHYLSLYFDKT
jgi:hypothetical protein